MDTELIRPRHKRTNSRAIYGVVGSSHPSAASDDHLYTRNRESFDSTGVPLVPLSSRKKDIHVTTSWFTNVCDTVVSWWPIPAQPPELVRVCGNGRSLGLWIMLLFSIIILSTYSHFDARLPTPLPSTASPHLFSEARAAKHMDFLCSLGPRHTGTSLCCDICY